MHTNGSRHNHKHRVLPWFQEMENTKGTIYSKASILGKQSMLGHFNNPKLAMLTEMKTMTTIGSGLNVGLGIMPTTFDL